MGAYVNLKNRASQNRAQNRADETHLIYSISFLSADQVSLRWGPRNMAMWALTARHA